MRFSATRVVTLTLFSTAAAVAWCGDTQQRANALPQRVVLGGLRYMEWGRLCWFEEAVRGFGMTSRFMMGREVCLT